MLMVWYTSNSMWKKKDIQTETVPDTTVTETHNKKGYLARHKVPLALLTLFVICIAAIAIVLLYFTKSAQPDIRFGDQHKPLTAQQLAAKAQATDKQVEDARIAQLQKLISGESDVTQKALYQSELASLYLSQHSYDKAKQVAITSDAAVKTAASASMVATVYDAAKEYTLAAKYYDLAMQRSPKPASLQERSPYNDYAYLKQTALEAAN